MFKYRAICLVIYCLMFNHVQQTQQLNYVNVALGKPTQQTDVLGQSFSSNAVDGYLGADDWGRCTHTYEETNNFWIVDLLWSYRIHTINITNRGGSAERLSNFVIYVSEVNPLPIPSPDGHLTGQLCLTQTSGIPPRGPHTVHCQTQSIRGRYVYVYKPANEYLTICEFEVLVQKQQLDLFQIEYVVYNGRKSSKAPFSSFTSSGRYSKIHCIQMCLAALGGYSTVVQIDEETKRCECIVHSDLNGSDPDIAVTGWVLIKSLAN